MCWDMLLECVMLLRPRSLQQVLTVRHLSAQWYSRPFFKFFLFAVGLLCNFVLGFSLSTFKNSLRVSVSNFFLIIRKAHPGETYYVPLRGCHLSGSQPFNFLNQKKKSLSAIHSGVQKQHPRKGQFLTVRCSGPWDIAARPGAVPGPHDTAIATFHIVFKK